MMLSHIDKRRPITKVIGPDITYVTINLPEVLFQTLQLL